MRVRNNPQALNVNRGLYEKFIYYADEGREARVLVGLSLTVIKCCDARFCTVESRPLSESGHFTIA